jgi:hypothetical protein
VPSLRLNRSLRQAAATVPPTKKSAFRDFDFAS